MDRAIDDAALGFTDSTELGMDDGMYDGTAVGDTLGLSTVGTYDGVIVGDALD